MTDWTRAAAATLLAMALTAAGAAGPNGASQLRAAYDAHKAARADSPFGRPLVLQSGDTAGNPNGDVYAVIDHPFATVAKALRDPRSWCDVLTVQTNVKRCAAGGQPPALQVALTRRLDQTLADAYAVDFAFRVAADDPTYLAVRLDAAEGPLGTRDYRVALEAMPIDAGRSFVHLSYAYTASLAARMATDAYLATAGRDKVGFSVTGRDDAGRPVLVGGLRGVAERNTMRYFLAIEAVLGTVHLPPERRVQQRLEHWFAATRTYPRQLAEMTRDEYLAMKRRELM